jgi:hypothetical protein
MEQLDTQLSFEQAHLAAERGLCNVEPGRGPGEVVLLGHGHCIGELLELHINPKCYQFDAKDVLDASVSGF